MNMDAVKGDVQRSVNEALAKRNTTIKVVRSGGFVVIELVTPTDEFVQIPLRKVDARRLGALLNKAGL